jgi:chromosomal replication initiator protein
MREREGFVGHDPEIEERPAEPEHDGAREPWPAGTLRTEYTFAHFVVGESNRRAYDVARRVAREATSSSLYLHGGVGVGKTHLAMAVGHAVRASRGERSVLVVSAERLASSWACARDERRALEQAVRDAHLLIVDDVQFLADDARGRDALLREVDAVRARGHQIVLTCDLPPHETPDLALPLPGSRASHAAELPPPDPDLRRQILVQKAARLGNDLAADVAAFIADVAPLSVRALEGALHRALQFAATLRVPLSVAVAARALDAWRRKPAPPPTLDAIAASVASEFGIASRHLRQSARRDRETVLARQVAIYLARRFSGRTLLEIAADYGCRDHSAASHANAAVKSRLARDPGLAVRLGRIERSLGSPAHERAASCG